MWRTTKYLLITGCLFGFLTSLKAQEKRAKKDSNDACYDAKQNALRDHRKNQLKYYAFGIAAPSQKFIDSLEYYHVTTVSLGCMADARTCYNTAVDSIIYSLYKVHIHNIR
jgi:hypothetical protein